MEGFGGTLRSFLDEIGLLVESLSGFALVIFLGLLVVAVLVVFGLVRR